MEVSEHDRAGAPSEEEAARVAKAQARARVEALVRECHPVALQMARAVCGNRWGDAEDLVQETLERALKDADWLSTLKKGELQGWVYATLYHRFIDLCRRRKTEQDAAPQLRAVQPDLASSPEDRYLQSWASYSPERFREAVEALEPKLRQCLELQLSGLKQREIAARLGVPQGSVGYWISEAKKHLRRRFLGPEGEAS